MSEVNFHITSTDKDTRYRQFMEQYTPCVQGETHPLALLANTTAALREVFGFFWVGFYLVADRQMTLGPFQGLMACSEIPYAKGVCGTAWATQTTQVVPDVNLFPGHIACSSLSRSEIVVPLIHRGEVKAVLDIDSDQIAHFDEIDKHHLEALAKILTDQIYRPCIST